MPYANESDNFLSLAIAEGIVRRGLAAPAIFLLEAHKPLLSVLQITCEAVQPLINLVIGPTRATSLVKYLNKPGSVEHLISEIERVVAEER